LERSTFRVLLVDDYEPWRAFVASTLKNQSNLRIIGEAGDGLEAVQIAQQLQPDLILLDIGLPTLNGIEAARRIREVSPKSKVLFVSENRSRDIAEEALRTGAYGYVVKAAAASELLPAVEAVLQDKRFVSATLTGSALRDLENERTAHDSGGDKVMTRTPPQNVETSRNHEVGFYSDLRALLENVTQFIAAALDVGNAADRCRHRVAQGQPSLKIGGSRL
jgi:DNA-binding NarL/FixJ family response regulator